MKIAAWNLNHRSRMKAIHQGIVDVIGEIAPDVLVLTEYVDGDSRATFKKALEEKGLLHISVSKQIEGHNQVLVASKREHSLGSVLAPVLDSHADTNFLSIHLLDSGLEIVGLRAPAYKTNAEIDAYWTALKHSLEGMTDRSVLIVGDMNGDPANPRSLGGRHMSQLQELGWMMPAPSGEWSYNAGGGASGSRIDHVLATASVGEIATSYITRVGHHILAGTTSEAPLSDHAILMAELRGIDETEGKLSATSRAEIILHLAAEGGGLDLVGYRKGDGWVFRRSVRDWTPELLDEEWIGHESKTVDTWEAALDLLDQYPWHKLSPISIHPEFRNAIFDAIEIRYDAGVDPANDRFAPAQRSSSAYRKWQNLCCGTVE